MHMDFRLYALKALPMLKLGLSLSLSLSFIPVNATSNPLTQLEPLGQLSTVSVHLIISALITGKLE